MTLCIVTYPDKTFFYCVSIDVKVHIRMSMGGKSEKFKEEMASEGTLNSLSTEIWLFTHGI